jgi:hypothetical protein
MSELKEFMLIFRMEPSNEQPTPEQLEEMGQQWGAFFGGIASKGQLVSTHHLGFSGKTISANHDTNDGFHMAEGQMVAGNLIVKAESMEAAIAIGKTCPILFAGGTVEVRDTIPM